MAAENGWIRSERDGDSLVLTAGGNWVIATLAGIDATLRGLAPAAARSARVDLSAVDAMDTAGAWVLWRTLCELRATGVAAEFAGARPAHVELLRRVETSCVDQEMERPARNPLVAMIERLGRATVDALKEGADLIAFLGITLTTTARAIARPARLRFTSLVSHIEAVGLNAMPIVGLLAFLIGVVVAYQGANQLTRFGAEIFTVDLLGVSILREMGVLLTAIIIAGRSGSAFTAQIGTMQVNEEVAAMRTLALDPMEFLVLPRLLALVVALPLLTIYADLMGLAGGALMSFAVLDISLVQFLERFNSAVPMTAFWVGLVKAPVFGFLVALVGCREGLNVRGSAESVGRQTTKSVAVSIFLVILFDALFSVFFSLIRI